MADSCPVAGRRDPQECPICSAVSRTAHHPHSCSPVSLEGRKQRVFCLHRVLFTQTLHRVLFTQSSVYAEFCLHRVYTEFCLQSSCQFWETKVMDSSTSFMDPFASPVQGPNEIFKNPQQQIIIVNLSAYVVILDLECIHMWQAVNHSLCKANVCLWSTWFNSASVWMSVWMHLFVYYVCITCTCIFVCMYVIHCWNGCSDMFYNCVTLVKLN